MRKQLITFTIASGLLAVAGPALADHNSKNGEGWANMPNDIHNTRIETMESGDDEAFRDFVQYGEGSTSVNRFATEDTQPNQAAAQNGNAKAAGNQVETKVQNQAKAMNQDKVQTQTATKDQSRIETRSQLRIDSPAVSRPDRGATSMRSGGSRSGGKR